MSANTTLVSTIRELLDRLVRSERRSNDEREVIKHEVADAVAALPRDGIIKALDRAVGSSKRRRKVSVYLLTQLTDVDEAINRIGQSLHDPDPEWRNLVVQIVGLKRLVQFADPLNELILSDPDRFIRMVAIHAAGSLKSEKNLQALLTMAKENPADLRHFILWALKEFAEESCRPFLVATFHNAASEKEHRVIAAWGLAKLGDRTAIEYLVQMLDDPDIHHNRGFAPGVSLRAAQALCDVHGWPFEWHKDWVEKTRERWRGGAS